MSPSLEGVRGTLDCSLDTLHRVSFSIEENHILGPTVYSESHIAHQGLNDGCADRGNVCIKPKGFLALKSPSLFPPVGPRGIPQTSYSYTPPPTPQLVYLAQLYCLPRM